VANLIGVKHIINNIKVKENVSPEDLKERIQNAFKRNAWLDSQRTTVELIGNKAVLRGTVSSLAEKDEAEKAVWEAPGISSIDNRLEVDTREVH
jgi:osmotically-inducible protein OsmY